MSLADDIAKLEKSRHASFTLRGVIAAKTQESAQRTHDALQRICATIIEAYRIANDQSKFKDEKVAALRKMTSLDGELEWIQSFCKDEEAYCREFKELHSKMAGVSRKIQGLCSQCLADLRNLEHDIECFPDVFEKFLSILENMTEFLKQCHASEVCRSIENGKNAYAEASNLLNLEIRGNLVPQSKLMSQRCTDYFKATQSLVKIQDDENLALHGRVDNVDLLIRKAMPEFILKTKDHIMNSPSSPELKEFQKQSYGDVVSCLDELTKILERVKVKYTSEFDEDAVKVNTQLDALDNAANEVLANIAKYRGMPLDADEDARTVVAEAIPEATKVTLSEMAKLRATPDDKKELIEQVKKARDGTVPEYFQAQEAVHDLVDKVKLSAPPVISIKPIMAEAISDTDGPRDLLEAAKAMCSALKNLNLKLDS